jgi:hypothetical protein
MIANSELFPSASLPALRLALARAFRPAPASAAAAQSGLGKSENKNRSDFCAPFVVLLPLNSFVINKISSKSASTFVDFLRFLCAKRPFFGPKWPNSGYQIACAFLPFCPALSRHPIRRETELLARFG